MYLVALDGRYGINNGIFLILAFFRKVNVKICMSIECKDDSAYIMIDCFWSSSIDD